MPIVKPGEKLPATYLERFEPAENVTYRLSVLSTAAVAVEFHWVDVPSKNIKGTYQCIQGACCQAFGRRSQTYNVPIYVYRNPQQGSTEGDLYIWQMTPSRWKKFSDMALQADLTQWDLSLTCQKRGLGLDWNYFMPPDYKFRDYWTPDQKEQLKLAVESFYQMGEGSIINNLMTYNDWNDLLYDCGYDVQNQCWPGGQSPMNSNNAFTAIGSAVRSPVLPPAPPSGFSPVVQALPVLTPASPVYGGGSSDHNVVFQPASPPPAGMVPNVSIGSPPPAGVVAPTHNTQTVSAGVVPQVNPGSISIGSGVVPSVPLGTAPVMPMPVAPQVPMQPVQSVPQNEVQTVAMEITAEELNKMLVGN